MKLPRHTAAAIEYCQQVVGGVVPACQLTRLACQRHLDDLERDDFPYCYDLEAAERACDFIESMPHIKGEWARKGLTIDLEPWQQFVVTATFGWVTDGTGLDPDGLPVSAGLRRFRQVYLEVARKNAKSTLAAAIANYMLFLDGEAGAEIYSCATTRDQAKLVFSVAKKMVEKCLGRGTNLGPHPVEAWKLSIDVPETASHFLPLHAEGNSLDGLNIHCAINDEVHAWKDQGNAETGGVYDAIDTATGARQQPLIFNITTAGVNRAGICYDLRGYLIKLLESTLQDETFFGCIWTIDQDQKARNGQPAIKGDDPFSPEAWRKANPNYGVSVYPMDMEAQARKAKQIPSRQVAFLTKRLNVWCNAEAAWMNMHAWDRCADHSLTLDDFHGKPCWTGVDLASKKDLTARLSLFKEGTGKDMHVYAFGRYWLPEAAVDNDPRGIYDGWVRAGWIHTTPGNVLDVDALEADTMELAGQVDLVELAIDPGHNSTQYGVHMAQQGLRVIDVRPTVLNFSDPLKWLEALVLDGRFHFNGDPVLTWAVSNVAVKADFKDNIYPRKNGGEHLKIDPVVAALMALNRMMAEESGYSVYDDRGVLVV